MAGEEKDCSICAKRSAVVEDFIGIPICTECYGTLDLDDLQDTDPDPELSTLLDPKGKLILGRVTSIIRSCDGEFGWKVLSLALFIGEQLEDRSRRTMMESALVLMGSAIIGSGEGSGKENIDEEKMISLLLIIGQYLDLSMMGKIANDEKLDPESYLDEIIMVFGHDVAMFNLLKALDHGNEPEKMTIVARAMKLFVK